MTGMKRFGESRMEAATPLPLASPSTCPLPTTTVEVTPENASAPNPDRVAAGERAPVRAIRAGVQGEGFRGIKGVTALSLAAAPAPATVVAALGILLQGELAARGAMVAAPLNARRQEAYAEDGEIMVSVRGTARESATLSILVPLPLLSLQKEEGRDVV